MPPAPLISDQTFASNLPSLLLIILHCLEISCLFIIMTRYFIDPVGEIVVGKLQIDDGATAGFWCPVQTTSRHVAMRNWESDHWPWGSWMTALLTNPLHHLSFHYHNSDIGCFFPFALVIFKVTHFWIFLTQVFLELFVFT